MSRENPWKLLNLGDHVGKFVETKAPPNNFTIQITRERDGERERWRK